MMGRKEALDALKPQLTAAIREWLDSVAATGEWEALDTYVGESLAGYMAEAGMAVLAGSVDLTAYYEKEKLLTFA